MGSAALPAVAVIAEGVHWVWVGADASYLGATWCRFPSVCVTVEKAFTICGVGERRPRRSAAAGAVAELSLLLTERLSSRD